jgi:hypothetical protein
VIVTDRMTAGEDAPAEEVADRARCVGKDLTGYGKKESRSESVAAHVPTPHWQDVIGQADQEKADVAFQKQG